MEINESDNCPNCAGRGKKISHGYFESVVSRCAFCKGSGEKKDFLKWFDNQYHKHYDNRIHKSQ